MQAKITNEVWTVDTPLTKVLLEIQLINVSYSKESKKCGGCVLAVP